MGLKSGRDGEVSSEDEDEEEEEDVVGVEGESGVERRMAAMVARTVDSVLRVWVAMQAVVLLDWGF